MAIRPILPPSGPFDLSVRLTRLDGLAGLLDSGQNCIIIEAFHSYDIGGLVFERDIAIFDTCSELALGWM